MSSSATGATDPHGWLPPGTRPGTVMAKVTGTSRETLNGQLAVVLAYMEDKERYVVHTTKEQKQLSLKPDNLLKASWMEQMTGQYEMIQNHPDIQRKVGEYYNLVQQKTGVKPEYVAVGVLVMLIAAVYFVGFSKIVMLVSFLMLVGIVIAPDVGSPFPVIARNFPMRVRTVIREQIPFVGPRIADNQYLSMALVGLVVFFFVNAMIRSPSSSKAASSWSPSSSVPPHVAQRNVIADRALLEDYYKKGFEDGQAGLKFGTSLPVPVTEETPVTDHLSPDDIDEFDFVDNSGIPPPRSSSSPGSGGGGFSWSSLLSLGFLGQSIYSMGKTVEGSWDWQLALANLKTMEPWRMGFFAFSLYRVGSAIFKSFF